MITVEDISKSVHAIILAGGSADNPLARYRAMPAVELGRRPGHSYLAIRTTAIATSGTTITEYGPPEQSHIAVPVPAGSSTQLIDISISNCIRSGVNKL